MNALAHPDFTIDDFEASHIDPDRFDHQAHVYVAWLYVQKYELTDAIGRFDAALKRLVAKLAANKKYHATITWFFLILVAERVKEDESWQSFRSRNDDLVRNSHEVLSRYYSKEQLFSSRAREKFVLPDNAGTR